MTNISEEKIKDLMAELLVHYYGGGFHLVHPKNNQSAEALDNLGYYNLEDGQLTKNAKEYYDEMFEKNKATLLRNLRLSKKNREKLTYRELSNRLEFPPESFYLLHFLRKLDDLDEITYQATDDSDDELKYLL